MDDDTRDFLRAQVAAEVGLPSIWSDRLTGDSVAALRDDAATLANVLGIAEPEPVAARDEAGRFASRSMNERIRAGRGTVIPPALREREPEPGRLGAGYGGANRLCRPT